VVQRAADSRDSHLTLRRVERQQRLVEILGASAELLPTAHLARRLGVGHRTVERDLARLRESGVPLETVPGPQGGCRLPRSRDTRPLTLTFTEVAALIASLAALGPTATDSSASAMRALVDAIAPESATRVSPTTGGSGAEPVSGRHVLRRERP
jgi:predicted DNA-binding transcriptional regulator YafY